MFQKCQHNKPFHFKTSVLAKMIRSLVTACKNTTVAPVPPSATLSAVSSWIFGPNKQTELNKNIELVTPQPIPLRSAVNVKSSGAEIIKVDSVSLCVIKSPNETLKGQEQKNQLHRLLLPYVVTSFDQDFETVSDEAVQEHCDHQLFGDYLFIAVANDTTKQEVSAADADVGPLVVFHLLCSSIEIDIAGIFDKLSSSHEQNLQTINNNKTVMCGAGYCCAVEFQKTGVATLVHNIAVRDYLKPQAVLLRTVNIAMVKLLKRTAPEGSRLYPNDLLLLEDEENTKQLSIKNKFQSKEQEWEFARAIANDALHKWSQLSTDAAKFDPERLVFRGVYVTNKLVQEKTSSSDGEETKLKEDVDVEPGDAQLRILVLPF